MWDTYRIRIEAYPIRIRIRYGYVTMQSYQGNPGFDHLRSFLDFEIVRELVSKSPNFCMFAMIIVRLAFKGIIVKRHRDLGIHDNGET